MSTTHSINTIHSMPSTGREKPPLKDFLSLVDGAMKVDHQVYSHQKLQPLRFGLNANLPGVINIVKSPWYIASNFAHFIKGKIQKAAKTSEEADYKMISHFLNFIQAIIIPFTYVATIGGVVSLGVSFLLPALIVLGFATSCIELYSNIKNLYEQNKFLKTFDLSILKNFSKSITLLTKQELTKTLISLINNITENCPCADLNYQNHLIHTLQDIRLNLSNSTLTLDQAQEKLKELLPDFKRDFVTKKIQVLKNTFFLLTEKEKSTILGKSVQYYAKSNYSETLHDSLSLVQEAFTDKKISLADRVQPWFALKLVNEYEGVLNNLTSEDKQKQLDGVHQGLELLERSCYNASLKKQIHITNIILFSLTIASYIVSSLFSAGFIPLIFFAISTCISYFNYVRINGVLNSKTYDVDWKNCCPSWVRSIIFKIRSLFVPQTNHPPISNVIEITSQVKKTPSS